MRRVLAVAVLLACAAGCARVPRSEIEAADAALARAELAQASEYAPSEMDEAREAGSRLHAELAAQRERSRLERSYERAIELAREVRDLAAATEARAVRERQSALEDAPAAIARARADLDEVRRLLEDSPRRPGTELDFMLLDTDLIQLENSLKKAEAALDDQRYLQARSYALAVRKDLSALAEEIQAAG